MTKLLTATALVAVFLCQPAAAQSSVCGPYDEFREALEKTFHEAPIGKGVTARGVYVNEIWISKAGTYTVLQVHVATGRTCIITAGKGWVEQQPEGSGRDI